MRRVLQTLLLCLLPLCLALPAQAAPGAPNGERRVALIIGNGAYPTGPLKNPPNDARDMAAKLKTLGFEVIQRENASLRQMNDAIDQFWQSLKKGGVGLFFFAGHGVQVGGENFLVPVDARIALEKDVQYECVNAGKVLNRMEDAGNGLNIVILDACRNNPFARSFRGESHGLARMDAPSGSLVAFATAPGDVAADGHGRNGLFTSHLLRHLGDPGLKVEDVLKRVRVGVAAESEKLGHRQMPWESSSLMGDFYFTGPGKDAPQPPQLALAVPPKAEAALASPAALPPARPARPALSGTYDRVLDEARRNDYAIAFAPASGGGLSASVSGGSNTSGIWPKEVGNVALEGDTLRYRLYFVRGLFGLGSRTYADVSCDLSAGLDTLPCSVRNEDGETYRQQLVRRASSAPAVQAQAAQQPATQDDLARRLVGKYAEYMPEHGKNNGLYFEFALKDGALVATTSGWTGGVSPIQVGDIRIEGDTLRFRFTYKQGLLGLGGTTYTDYTCDLSRGLDTLPATYATEQGNRGRVEFVRQGGAVAAAAPAAQPQQPVIQAQAAQPDGLASRFAGRYAVAPKREKAGPLVFQFEVRNGQLVGTPSGGGSATRPVSVTDIKLQGNTLSFRYHYQLTVFGTARDGYTDFTGELGANMSAIPFRVMTHDGNAREGWLLRLPEGK